LGKDSLETEEPVWSVKPFRDSREVYLRLDSLPPGLYLVIPSKYLHNQSGEFILRVFSPQSISLRSLHYQENFRKRASLGVRPQN
jgi:hypothetical protein